MFRLFALLSLTISIAFGGDLEALRTKAASGDAQAQYELGTAFHKGEGVDKNLRTAVEWIRKAADQNHGPAVVSMVYHCEKGEGVAKDLADAERWYEKALELGYTRDLAQQKDLIDYRALFAKMDAKLRALPDASGEEYVEWVKTALKAKQKLWPDPEELDFFEAKFSEQPWLESLKSEFPENWKILRAVALGYCEMRGHVLYYALLDRESSTKGLDQDERLRWIRLKLLKKAYSLATTESAPEAEMAPLIGDYLTVLLERRIGHHSERLQLLTTDLSKKQLAELDDRPFSAEPMFYTRPTSPAAAKNDGELILSLLGRYDLTIKDTTFPREIQLAFVKASYLKKHEAPRFRNELIWNTLHHLTDNEYVVWDRLVPHTKKLPAEHDYITQLIALVDQAPEIIGAFLGSFFQSRCQLARAAEYFEMASDTNMVRSIRANQGTLSRCESLPAGVPVMIDYKFRNGEHLAVELLRKNTVTNLLERLEAGTLMHSELNLLKAEGGSFGKSIALEKVAAFDVALDPLSDHRDTTQTITLGPLEAGSYLVFAKMKNGNESEVFLNIRDTIIYYASTPSEVRTNAHTLVILCDARTGAPRPHEKIAIVELSGGSRRDENQKTVDGPYSITKQINAVTDANGCFILEENALSEKDAEIHLLANLDGFPTVMESGRWDRNHISTRLRRYQAPFVATDRPIYRPGDEGNLMIWQAAKTNEFKLRIRENRSKFDLPVVGDSILRPNLFGAMKATFEIPEDARLGKYDIQQTVDDTYGFPWGNLQVEKFRAPEFEVAIQQLADGRIEISAEYAYGAPVAGGRVSGTISFAETSLTPWHPSEPFDGLWGKGYWWHGTQFGHDEINLEEAYSEKDVKLTLFGSALEHRFELVLDANGKALINASKSVKSDEARAAMSYRVQAKVMDAANKEYSTSEHFMNNTKEATLCCWADKAFFEQGEDIVIHTAAEKKGELTLHYERVSGTNAIAVSETKNLAPGLYQVKARDAEGAESEPFQFFVLGNANTELTAKNPIRVVVEKGVYDADETAIVLIQVDQPGRHVYFFDRLTGSGGYSLPQTFMMDETSKRIELPLNGVAGKWQFGAMTVVDGKRHTTAGTIRATEPSKKAGRIEIMSDQKTYKPGATAKVALRAINAAGEGENCAIAISVYNKTLDSLIQHASARAIFWSLFSTWINDSYHSLNFKHGWPKACYSSAPAWVMKRLGPYDLEGFYSAQNSDGDVLYCDSAMEESGVAGEQIYLRENLADHAYWNAFVETDENGEATVEFTVPDTMTEWKIAAWAVHTNFAANGEAAFQCAKELVVQLNTPRYMVAGDKLDISASVRNHTTNTLSITTRTSLSMMGTVIRALEPAAEKMMYWKHLARKPGVETVKVSAQGGGLMDGVSKPMPVLPRTMRKRGADGGVLTAENRTTKIAINIPEEITPKSLTLDLNATPNLLETVAGALPFLAEYPHGCTEQTLNKFLPAVITLQTLDQLNLTLEDLASAMPPERQAIFDRAEIIKRAKVGVERLREARAYNGSWSWNLDDTSRNEDPLVTAWVTRGLAAAAKNMDLHIELEQTIDKMVDHLDTLSRPPWRRRGTSALSSTDVFTAVVLQELGPEHYLTYKHDLEAAAELMSTIGPFLKKHAAEFSLYGQTLLAYFFELRDETAPRDVLLAYIEQFLETDPAQGTYWLRGQSKTWWRWYNDEIEIMAWYLKLLNRVEPNSAKTAGVARWLLINRQHGDHWKSTRDTAICVEALCEFIVNNPATARDGGAAAKLNGGAVEAGLKPGLNTLELTALGAHPVFYDVAWSYETRENPIAAERCDLVDVKRAYYRIDGDTRIALATDDAIKTGETIEVKLTFTAPMELEYLLATDRKPAGFECLETASGYARDSGLRHYRELHDERVACYIDRLPKGESTIRYRLRAEHAGQVSALPATIELMYAPKQTANSAERKLRVKR